MSLAERIETLHSLVRLIVEASGVVVQEWQAAAMDSPGTDPATSLLPSLALYDARRTVLGACGMLSDTVAEPQQRLMEIALGYYVPRALHVAAEGHIADILAVADPAEGMHIQTIAHKASVEQQKLGGCQSCPSSPLIRLEQLGCSVLYVRSMYSRRSAKTTMSTPGRRRPWQETTRCGAGC